MVSCSISNCHVTGRNNPEKYTFHRFPTCPHIREKWARIANRSNWSPQKNSSICSRHFEERCFLQRNSRRILMKESIPTLFIPIKLIQRPVSSYVNRDITCSSSLSTPGSSETSASTTKRRNITDPSPSIHEHKTQIFLPERKKLMEQNIRLKRKLLEKKKMVKRLVAQTKRLKARVITLKNVVKHLKNTKNRASNNHNEVQVHFQTEFVPIAISTDLPMLPGQISPSAESEEDLTKSVVANDF